MKLEEAIEILIELPDNVNNVLDCDQLKAINLGIEALKFYKGAREVIGAYKGMLLPGETEEVDDA